MSLYQYETSPNNLQSINASDVDTVHHKMTIKDAEKILASYTNISSFSDNTWIIDKIEMDKQSTNKMKSIYFSQIKNEKCIVQAKCWALLQLIQHKNRRTINIKMIKLAKLSVFIDDEYDFETMPKTVLIMLYNSKKKKKKSMKYSLEIWHTIKTFLKEMNFIDSYNQMCKFVVEAYPEFSSDNNRYIPDEVIEKLDIRMLEEDIPLAFKLIYWLLRFIPNRITEVLSMNDKCLKKISEDSYVISIPTFKQAGSFHKGSVKLIEIKYDDVGKMLINLIEKQIQFIKEHEINNDNGFLFYSESYGYFKCDDGHYKYKIQNKAITPITMDRVNSFFKTLCKKDKITDKNGKLYSFTSHQLRHDAISDRITSGIFRPIDIMGLTAHHNTKMIENTYTHYKVSDLCAGNNKAIVFRGRIINTDDDRRMQQILEKPFAKLIHEIGICSDIRSCDKDKSQCLRCEYMVPDIDNLSHYRDEKEEWQTKYEKAVSIGNQSFAELCMYWIESYSIIISRVLHAISDDDIEIESEEV